MHINRTKKAALCRLFYIVIVWGLFFSCSAELVMPKLVLEVEKMDSHALIRAEAVQGPAGKNGELATVALILTFDGPVEDLLKEDISLTCSMPDCLLAKERLVQIGPGVFTLYIGAVIKNKPAVTRAEVIVAPAGLKGELLLTGAQKVEVDFLPVLQSNYKLFKLKEAVPNGSDSPFVPTTNLRLTVTADEMGLLPNLLPDDVVIQSQTPGMTMTKKQITPPLPVSGIGPFEQVWDLEIADLNKNGPAWVSIEKPGYMQDSQPLLRNFFGFSICFFGIEEAQFKNDGTTPANDGQQTEAILTLSDDIPGLSVSDIIIAAPLPANVSLTGLEAMGGGKYRLRLRWGSEANWSHAVMVRIAKSGFVLTPSPERQLLLSLKKTVTITRGYNPVPDNAPAGPVANLSVPVSFKTGKVPGGKFQRDGSGSVSTLTKTYWMGETEVTRDLWWAVMGYWPGGENSAENTHAAAAASCPPGSGRDPWKLPAREISWIEAIVFCNKLSLLTGKTPVYSVSSAYAYTTFTPEWLYEVPAKDRQGNDIDDAWVQAKFGPGKTLALLQAAVGKANKYKKENGVWVLRDENDDPYDGDSYWPDYDPDIGDYWTGWSGWLVMVMPGGSISDIYDYENDPYGFKTPIPPPTHAAITDAAGWQAFNNPPRKFRADDSDWPKDNSWYTLVTIDETADGFRLPSLNQWRWAAMGADMNPAKLVNGVNVVDRAKPFSGYNGNNTITDYAWFNDTRISTWFPVARKKPNELGLYDMSGSLLEWCWDPHNASKDHISTGPMGDSDYNTYTDGVNRILMGGWAEDRIYRMSLSWWNYRDHDHFVIGGLGTIDQGLRIIRYE
jgi:formylglycine-generating enzyme required for sulfatase activity